MMFSTCRHFCRKLESRSTCLIRNKNRIRHCFAKIDVYCVLGANSHISPRLIMVLPSFSSAALQRLHPSTASFSTLSSSSRCANLETVRFPPEFRPSSFGNGKFVSCEPFLRAAERKRVRDARRGFASACLGGRVDYSTTDGGVEQREVAVEGVVLMAREEHYKEAVRALGSEQVIAVPTDTLYGLACDASSAEAIRRVYEIKERKLSSPLAVCVSDVDVVAAYGETAQLPAGLLKALLPGAVTLLLPRRELGFLSASLNPGIGSIGIRIPDSDFIRGVARSFGGALALTSANTSSHASTVRIEEFEHLWPHCAFVFDAGTLPGGRAGSTIVDLTQEGVFKMIRPGSVFQKTQETLAQFGLRDLSS